MSKQKKRKPEEIIRILRSYEVWEGDRESFCQSEGISVSSLSRWRKQYGMMSEGEAKRLKALEKENAELKKMYADAMLGMKVLKEALEKKL